LKEQKFLMTRIAEPWRKGRGHRSDWRPVI
jgi:hypothetical protein